MTNALIRKLRRLHHLTEADITALGAATSRPNRYDAHRDLSQAGKGPGWTIVMMAGWACRQRKMTAGVSQITGFLMPGDACEMNIGQSANKDDGILTLTTADVVLISRVEIYRLMAGHPNVARAWILSQLIDEGTMRTWMVSLGRRNSVERVAHLVCELNLRALNVGLSDERGMILPFTQAMLADALGITPVHISRSLRVLRLAGAMSLRNGMLKVINISRLTEIAGFDDRYLNLTPSAAT